MRSNKTLFIEQITEHCDGSTEGGLGFECNWNKYPATFNTKPTDSDKWSVETHTQHVPNHN